MGDKEKPQKKRSWKSSCALSFVGLLVLGAVLFTLLQSGFAVQKLPEQIESVFATIGLRPAEPEIEEIPAPPETPWGDKLREMMDAGANHDEIDAFLNAELQKLPGDVDLRLSIAGNLFEDGDLRESYRLSKDLLEEDSKNAAAHQLLSKSAIALGNKENGAQYYEEALQSLEFLGKIRGERVKAYRRAVDAGLALAEIHGSSDKAVEVYRDVQSKLKFLTKKQPGNKDLLYLLASVSAKLGESTEAFEIYDSLPSRPEDRETFAEVCISAAQTWLNKGGIQNTVKCVSRYFSLSPEKELAPSREVASLFSTTGEELWKAGEREAAVIHFEKSNEIGRKAARTSKSDAEVRRSTGMSHLRLAEIYEELAHEDKALDHYILFVSAIHELQVDKLSTAEDDQMLDRYLPKIVAMRKTGRLEP